MKASWTFVVLAGLVSGGALAAAKYQLDWLGAVLVGVGCMFAWQAGFCCGEERR